MELMVLEDSLMVVDVTYHSGLLQVMKQKFIYLATS